ncbi:MAG: trpF [Rhodospirillales bacterium]|jgi:phosphoribosylanthranilate isomerase|nr:trpF [Rhodospirillales bacterium]
MPVAVKICGLDRTEAVDAAVEGGAQYTGFVFYPPSPRNLTPERAGLLTSRVPSSVMKVGLFVDPTDAEIDAVLALNALDMIQLHGSETPERVADVKRRSGRAVMKAIKIAAETDVITATRYYDVADRILFDALAPASMTNALPGGNALSFDWTLLDGLAVSLPWMLAGGLTAGNLAEAIRLTKAPAVDVSSGVEERPGVKSLDKIRAFLAAAEKL